MFGSPGTILMGDALATLRTLPDQFFQCCVTSPPYWKLRDYHADGQMSKSERYYYDHEAVREPTAAASVQERAQSPGALSWNRLVNEPERPGQQYPQHRITKRYSTRPGIDTRGGGQGSGVITFDPDTRNRRSVWRIATCGFHGTVGVVCVEEGRRYLGIEINPDYVAMASE